MSKETFEDALAQLEDVVKRLEDDSVGLEEALKLFEKGVKLSRRCRSQLTEVESRVEQLLAEASRARSPPPGRSPPRRSELGLLAFLAAEREAVDAGLERLAASVRRLAAPAARGDALRGVRRRQAGAADPRPGGVPRRRRRSRARPRGGLRPRADPHLLAHPRRPAGPRQRHPAARPAHRPRGLRRGARHPGRRRPAHRGVHRARHAIRRAKRCAARRAEACRAGGSGRGLPGAWSAARSRTSRPPARPRTPQRLERIHRAKTGALLAASVELGAVLAGVGRRARAAVRRLRAASLGLALSDRR